MNRCILPNRSLGLRAGFYVRRALLLLLLLPLTALFAWGAYSSIASAWAIRRDEWLWAHGKRATEGHVRGKVAYKGIRWLYADYDLDIAYSDAAGAQYEGTAHVTTMFGSLEDDYRPELRYDPAHPGHFALSWAVYASGARWRWAVCGGATLSFLTMGWALMSLGVVLHALAIRRLARRGDEVVARVDGITVVYDRDRKPTSEHRFSLVLPAAPGRPERRWSETLDIRDATPLCAGSKGTTTFALHVAGSKGNPLLLRNDLYPLQVTAAELDTARRLAHEAGHAGPAAPADG